MKNHEQCVYIVDDDAAVRDSLSLLLGLNGFHTLPFASADDFLRVFDATWSGCLLLDIRMPGTDGLALQVALKERNVALPIIFMTAHGEVATVRTALKGGAVDYLEKPVDPDAMLAAVRARSSITPDLLFIDRICTYIYWTATKQKNKAAAAQLPKE